MGSSLNRQTQLHDHEENRLFDFLQILDDKKTDVHLQEPNLAATNIASMKTYVLIEERIQREEFEARRARKSIDDFSINTRSKSDLIDGEQKKDQDQEANRVRIVEFVKVHDKEDLKIATTIPEVSETEEMTSNSTWMELLDMKHKIAVETGGRKYPILKFEGNCRTWTDMTDEKWDELEGYDLVFKRKYVVEKDTVLQPEEKKEEITTHIGIPKIGDPVTGVTVARGVKPGQPSKPVEVSRVIKRAEPAKPVDIVRKKVAPIKIEPKPVDVKVEPKPVEEDATTVHIARGGKTHSPKKVEIARVGKPEVTENPEKPVEVRTTLRKTEPKTTTTVRRIEPKVVEVKRENVTVRKVGRKTIEIAPNTEEKVVTVARTAKVEPVDVDVDVKPEEKHVVTVARTARPKVETVTPVETNRNIKVIRTPIDGKVQVARTTRQVETTTTTRVVETESGDSHIIESTIINGQGLRPDVLIERRVNSNVNANVNAKEESKVTRHYVWKADNAAFADHEHQEIDTGTKIHVESFEKEDDHHTLNSTVKVARSGRPSMKTEVPKYGRNKVDANANANVKEKSNVTRHYIHKEDDSKFVNHEHQYHEADIGTKIQIENFEKEDDDHTPHTTVKVARSGRPSKKPEVIKYGKITTTKTENITEETQRTVTENMGALSDYNQEGENEITITKTVTESKGNNETNEANEIADNSISGIEHQDSYSSINNKSVSFNESVRKSSRNMEGDKENVRKSSRNMEGDKENNLRSSSANKNKHIHLEDEKEEKEKEENLRSASSRVKRKKDNSNLQDRIKNNKKRFKDIIKKMAEEESVENNKN